MFKVRDKPTSLPPEGAATTEKTVRDALGLCCLEKRRQVLLRGSPDHCLPISRAPGTDVLLDCRKQVWECGWNYGEPGFSSA